MKNCIMLMLVTLFSSFGWSSANANECIYSPEIIKEIATGLRFPDAKVDAEKSVAFKSNDFKKIYFLAAPIKSEAFDPSIGVWAVNGLDSGMVFSANTDAAITTVFPDGQKSGPQVKASDHGYNQAIQCLKAKFKL